VRSRTWRRGRGPVPTGTQDWNTNLLVGRIQPRAPRRPDVPGVGSAPGVAAGGTPNTEGLGLEQAGVHIDARGRILVDRYYPTTAPGIYAAGDVVKPALASNAMQQGRPAAAHACGLVFGVEIDQTASSAVYGLPEVASVGATEEQIRAAGIR
jgi:NAD(P) transhydrogenase